MEEVSRWQQQTQQATAEAQAQQMRQTFEAMGEAQQAELLGALQDIHTAAHPAAAARAPAPASARAGQASLARAAGWLFRPRPPCPDSHAAPHRPRASRKGSARFRLRAQAPRARPRDPPSPRSVLRCAPPGARTCRALAAPRGRAASLGAARRAALACPSTAQAGASQVSPPHAYQPRCSDSSPTASAQTRCSRCASNSTSGHRSGVRCGWRFSAVRTLYIVHFHVRNNLPMPNSLGQVEAKRQPPFKVSWTKLVPIVSADREEAEKGLLCPRRHTHASWFGDPLPHIDAVQGSRRFCARWH